MQGCTNFPKIEESHRNYVIHKDDVHKVPYGTPLTLRATAQHLFSTPGWTRRSLDPSLNVQRNSLKHTGKYLYQLDQQKNISVFYPQNLFVCFV